MAESRGKLIKLISPTSKKCIWINNNVNNVNNVNNNVNNVNNNINVNNNNYNDDNAFKS